MDKIQKVINKLEVNRNVGTYGKEILLLMRKNRNGIDKYSKKSNNRYYSLRAILGKRKLAKKTKMRVYNAVVIWTLQKKHNIKITTVQVLQKGTWKDKGVQNSKRNNNRNIVTKINNERNSNSTFLMSALPRVQHYKSKW